MENCLLILGAGQFGRVAKEIAESMGCFAKIDFLDDKSELAIDSLESYNMYVGIYEMAIVAIGDPDVRLDYICKLGRAGFKIATLVSPRAYVAPSATVMCGSIIEPMAVVNANAMVESGVIVCAGAIINHNAVVSEGCLLQCGSVVTSAAHIPHKTRIDYNDVYYCVDD